MISTLFFGIFETGDKVLLVEREDDDSSDINAVAAVLAVLVDDDELLRRPRRCLDLALVGLGEHGGIVR